jgi:hypothetical protein
MVSVTTSDDRPLRPGLRFARRDIGGALDPAECHEFGT